MTRTIYAVMNFVGAGLWMVFGFAMFAAIVMGIDSQPLLKVGMVAGGAIGCMFGAILMQAIAAIGTDLYVIRKELAGEEEEEETDPHIQAAGEA